MTDWRPGGVIESPWQEMRHHIRAYLHEDEAAREVGLRGGVIGGYNYMSLAALLFEQQYGSRWLNEGRLTARWGSPVYEGDEVRAVVSIAGAGDDLDATYVIERRDGEVVTRGTVCWVDTNALDRGDDGASVAAEELHDLRVLSVGERLPATEVTARREDVDGFCERTNDALYRPDRIPTAYLARLCWLPARAVLDARGVGAGLFGQVDIRQFQPLAPEVPYGYDAEVLALRRRGHLEILDIRLSVLAPDGAPMCVIDQTQLFPHPKQQ
jgi:hypothetical protein